MEGDGHSTLNPEPQVPLLDRSLKASRYLADFEELSQLGKGSFGKSMSLKYEPSLAARKRLVW